MTSQAVDVLLAAIERIGPLIGSTLRRLGPPTHSGSDDRVCPSRSSISLSSTSRARGIGPKYVPSSS
jgi:hypothetical protein